MICGVAGSGLRAVSAGHQRAGAGDEGRGPARPGRERSQEDVRRRLAARILPLSHRMLIFYAGFTILL